MMTMVMGRCLCYIKRKFSVTEEEEEVVANRRRMGSKNED